VSEKEFELYLSLLSRFLRLSPSQRAEVADELRDHLEERLEELTAAGLAREDAIRTALDEFGDAAELSTHFTQLARTRRRRLIMRITAGSALTAAAVLLLALFLQPEMPPQNVGARLVAQQDPEPEVSESSANDEPAEGDPAPLIGRAASERVEQKLQEPLDLVVPDDTTLGEALDMIAEAMQVDVLAQWARLGEEGIERDMQVGLEFRYTKVSAAVFLEMLLNPLALGYRVREGFIEVSTQIAIEEDEEFLEIRVYNVRDLLQHGGTVDSLSNLLRRVLAKNTAWEDEDGFGGAIAEFDGLLVVLQTQQAHRQIEVVLEVVRQADIIGPWSENQPAVNERGQASASAADESEEPQRLGSRPDGSR
jgi:hypothetical protein